MLVNKLANMMASQFIFKTRSNGDSFIVLKKDCPNWMNEICLEAHHSPGDRFPMLPDDHRYRFIKEAVEAIAEHDDLEEARIAIEPDIYTKELTDWLASRNDRMHYCEQYEIEFGAPCSGEMINRIMNGQIMEKWEVFDKVESEFKRIAEELEDHLSSEELQELGAL